MSNRFSTFICALLLTGAVAGVRAADQAPGASNLPRVRDAYARAVPPGQQNSAAFMRILNSGEQTRALIAAQSSVARVVELHTHVRQDGMMSMRRVERIELPAGAETLLEPGGLHLMLIGLKKPLAPGEPIDLHLVLDNGKTIDLTADTKAIMPAHRSDHQATDP